MKVLDPLKFAAYFWPGLEFYHKQREIIYSVVYNRETIVHAGNKLGKDFVAGFIALWFFLSRHPCRIVTTSADYSQLESVLWGEIRRFIQTAKYPLSSDKGGPIVCNHLHLKKMIKGQECATSYVIGRTAAKGEGMLGHHANFPVCCGIQTPMDGTPRTLFLGDESSGLDDVSIERATTWADRMLLIGNPFPCNNYFYRAIKSGNIESKAH